MREATRRRETYLNLCASGPHNSHDWLIAGMGIKIWSPLLMLRERERIYIGFTTGESEVYLIDSWTTPFLSVYGFSTGNMSSFIAIRTLPGTAEYTRRISLTVASR